jgi:hypothetical protein
VIDLPLEQAEIEQATLEGKYLISRAGKMVWITLILNKIPTLFTREILKFFCELFEGQFEDEILNLYTNFQGDISIFRKQSRSKQSVENIIEDVFHLYLTLPFKIGSTKGIKFSSKSKRVYQIAKELSHETKGYFSLESLFTKINDSLEIKNNEIADLIFELIQSKVLLTVSSEKRKRKFIIHF